MTFQNPASIWSDPTFLAYRASLGLEADTAASRYRAAADAARRNTAQQIADLTANGAQQRVGIGNNFEGRGFSRSSGREITMANQRAGEGRAVAGATSNLAGQLADYESQIAQARLASQQQAAEAAFNAAPKVQQFAEGY
jgi:hypothetical protein